MIFTIFNHFLNFLLKIGIHSELNYDAREKVRILNGVNLILTLAVFSYIVIDIIIENYYELLENSLFMVFGLWIIFIFQHFRYYTFAKLYLTIILSAFVFYNAISGFISGISRYTDLENIYILQLPLIVLLFENRLKWILYLVGALALLSLKTLKYYFLEIPYDIRFFFTLQNSAIAILGVYAVTAFFKDELTKTKVRLQKQNAEKNQLFSIIAHDLKSPLNTLNAALDLMKHDLVSPEEFKSFILQISENIHYSNQLLNNLLYWAKSQMNKQTIDLDLFAIEPLIETNIYLFSTAAQKKGISLTFSYLEKPQHFVYADKNMIDLVIRNLVSNALKFTHRGGKITLSLQVDAKTISVIVQDNGIGLSQDMLQKIMASEMITQRGTQGEKGSGLGLLLCKEFVEKNKGTFRVVSQENKGSTFSFTLPSFLV